MVSISTIFKSSLPEPDRATPCKRNSSSIEPKIAESTGGVDKVHQLSILDQLSILAILEARNDQEKLKGDRIQDFAVKITELFACVQNCDEGKRLVVKINSKAPEEEIYEEFARIYTKSKILNQKTVGDYFFKETKYLVNKFCDDFEFSYQKLICDYARRLD